MLNLLTSTGLEPQQSACALVKDNMGIRLTCTRPFRVLPRSREQSRQPASLSLSLSHTHTLTPLSLPLSLCPSLHISAIKATAWSPISTITIMIVIIIPGCCQTQGLHASLQAFAMWPAEKPDTASKAPFLLAAALVMQSLPQWKSARRETLLQTLRYGLARPVGVAGPSAPPPGPGTGADNYGGGGPGPTDQGLAAAAAPALRLWGLVDWLQGSLKREAPSQKPLSWGARCDRVSTITLHQGYMVWVHSPHLLTSCPGGILGHQYNLTTCFGVHVW